MKLIIKNGTLEFQRVHLTELQPLNMIGSSYVRDNGSVSNATSVVWTNVYELTAGKTYWIKGDDDWFSGTTAISINVYIATGSNHLTTIGSITDFSSLYTISVGGPAPTMQFTPNANCYLYVSCIDETPSKTTKKIPSVYEF